MADGDRALQALIRDCARVPRMEQQEIEALVMPCVEAEARAVEARTEPPPRPKALLDRLVVANMALVVHMAMKSRRKPSEALDLVQAGALGLHRAAQKYDPTKGTKFSTYAAWWIRAEMRMLRIRNFSIVNIGTGRANRTSIFKIYAMMQDGMGLDAIAAALGSTPANVDRLRAATMGDVSTDAPAFEVGRDAVGDRMGSDPDPEETLHDALLVHDLRELMQVYRSRLRRDLEREVFDARIANEVETLAEVGLRCGVSRERVRQIEEKQREQLIAMARNYYEVDRAGAA